MARRTATSDRRLAGSRGRGYTLVALIVALVVLNIAVAAAMQLWSAVIQRENEAEMIFRGLQYAEAIRVFQARFNRPPTSLEELLEVEPRCIRQLWTEPISDSGAWQPLLAGSGTDVTELAQGQELGGSGSDPFEDSGSGFGDEPSSGASGDSSAFGSEAAESQIGPIEGVRPTSTGSSMKVFLGQTEYESWEFRAQMLAAPQVTPEGVPLTPRLDPGALGRPFPEGLQAVPGSTPHPEGAEENPFDSEEDEEG